MSKEKDAVKEYYETFGWQKTIKGVYKDTYLNVDQRKSESFYSHLNLSILRRNFKRKGAFFLDVGCGANPCTTLAQDFNFHVCVDFAKAGLVEAKRKIANGMFVIADLTNLPFKTSVFDGAVAMHVLYHLPRECQSNAVSELARIIAGRSHCLIAYSNFEGPNRLFRLLPQRLRQLKRKNRDQIMRLPDEPPLYAHVFSLEYFKNLPLSGYKLKFRTAHLIGGLSKIVVPNGLAGYLVLSIVLFIERFFSGTAAKYSVYPAIVIEKN
jgi:SAM-dependent methyltransferase